MNMSDMKNMIVLKNLPSNLVDEAIIILKENKKIHKYEMADENEYHKNISRKSDVKGDNKNQNKIDKSKQDDKNYIIKEAEMLVQSYTKKLEEKSPKHQYNMKKLEKRYKNSIKLNFFLGFTTIITATLMIIFV